MKVGPSVPPCGGRYQTVVPPKSWTVPTSRGGDRGGWVGWSHGAGEGRVGRWEGRVRLTGQDGSHRVVPDPGGGAAALAADVLAPLGVIDHDAGAVVGGVAGEGDGVVVLGGSGLAGDLVARNVGGRAGLA